MRMTLGIDLACRAAHVASLAGTDGTLVWRGRKFFSRTADLERLWADIGRDPTELMVVLEPTRNAWIPVAAWFRRRGVKVVMVPTTQSADLRAYYSKHTKNDRLDSALLARLPLLHPEGLREYTGDGPADPLRRVVKQRSSIAKRRAAVFNRLDAQLELLGPSWYDALGTDYGKATLAFLARYADPNAVIRLGQARLARFLARYSRGHWRKGKAGELIAAAHESLRLWDGDGLDFAELAADITVEAEQAQALTEQITDLDQRIANLYDQADPAGIIRSAPGVGPVLAGIIAGRLGDPHRFTSLAAEQARKLDPQLTAKYARLMAADRHHDSAVCHLATILLTRIATCWRAGQSYQIRDVHGTPLTMAEGKRIVVEKYQVPKKPSKKRYYRATNHKADRGSQESPNAPTPRPANTHPKTPRVA